MSKFGEVISVRNPRLKMGFLCLIIVGLIVLGTALRKSNQEEETLAALEPGVSFSGVELVGRSQGRRQWELVSHNLHQEGEDFYLDQLERVILLENEQPKYYVYADNGIWSPESGSLQLRDNVVVNDNEGFWLTTDSLVWYQDRESFDFFGPTSVVFEQGGEADE